LKGTVFTNFHGNLLVETEKVEVASEGVFETRPQLDDAVNLFVVEDVFGKQFHTFYNVQFYFFTAGKSSLSHHCSCGAKEGTVVVR
jgi:hypothetical protein